MRRLVALVTFALMGAGATPAIAQSRCPIPGGASTTLAALDPALRLDFVRATLSDQASRARLWSWGWAGAGVLLAGGSYGIAALEPTRDLRIEYVLAGTPAFWYPFLAVVDPPEVIADDRTLRDLLALTASPVGKMDTCLLLGRGEELLANAAVDEAARTNLFQHGLGVVVSVGIAVVIALALKDTAGGILNGVASVGVSELNLWTAPTGAVGALARYREGVLRF